jgi:predicted flavoprotein YhiN
MDSVKNSDVLIAGGGPSGQMAAIAAAQQGASVFLCEQSAALGAKLLMSGGGRCNLSNTHSPVDFAAQIDKNTLQSTNVQGLFFAGEVLDIDGPCGGYNLQRAFSSGYLAGSAASAQKKE